MALDHILKAAPFTWGAGSVGSTGLGIGGGYLHEEVSNVAWDHQLGREGYSLNIPDASSWGPKEVTDGDDTFEEAKKIHSGPCFENFFSEVGKIKDVLTVEEVKGGNFVKKKQSSDPAIGCAIQKISYKEKLTEIKDGPGKGGRVLPKSMVYKSEITLKKGDLGLAVGTLGTGKLVETNQEFKEGESRQQYKVFLLAKEDNKGVAKGKYNLSSTDEFTITSDKLYLRKMSMKVKDKQEVWFDATVTYTDADKQKYQEDNTWKNRQSVSFGEEGGTEGFSNILIMGSGALSLFTGDPKVQKEKQEIPKMFEKENLLRAGHLHFNGTKGEWREPKEFCEYMQKTKGKNVSGKDAYIAKNLCYKK